MSFPHMLDYSLHHAFEERNVICNNITRGLHTIMDTSNSWKAFRSISAFKCTIFGHPSTFSKIHVETTLLPLLHSSSQAPPHSVPLGVAALNGHLKTTERLLVGGANINYQDEVNYMFYSSWKLKWAHFSITVWVYSSLLGLLHWPSGNGSAPIAA